MKQNLSFKTFLQDFQSSLIEAKFDDFLMNIFLKIFLYYTANFQFCMNDIIQKQATVWSENCIFAQQIQSFGILAYLHNKYKVFGLVVLISVLKRTFWSHHL